MTQIGSFTRTSDGSYTGTIKTLAFMRASGEAQATFGGGDCAPISAFGGARVVGTARCIRYVYPARGANPQYLKSQCMQQISRAGAYTRPDSYCARILSVKN
jgi:hypothetical protein